jgi:hypothetical protein
MKFPAAIINALPTFGGKQWVEVNIAKLAGLPGLSSLGRSPTMNDPSQMLQYLRAESDNVTNEGPQLVDGVQMTHYRVALDPGRIAANVPAAERAVVQRALTQLTQSTGVHQLPVDVWIDAHHFVRRMAMALSVSTGTAGTIRETITAELGDYGPQPRPTPPPSNQVQDLSSLIHVGG